MASWDAKVDSPGSHDALGSEGWPVGGCHFGSLDSLLSQGCAPVAHLPVPQMKRGHTETLTHFSLDFAIGLISCTPLGLGFFKDVDTIDLEESFQ